MLQECFAMLPNLNHPGVSSRSGGGGENHTFHHWSTEQTAPRWSRGRAVSGTANKQAEIWTQAE